MLLIKNKEVLIKIITATEQLISFQFSKLKLTFEI